MEELDALQGLQEIELIMSQGQPSGHGFTHDEFEENRVKQKRANRVCLQQNHAGSLLSGGE